VGLILLDACMEEVHWFTAGLQAALAGWLALGFRFHFYPSCFTGIARMNSRRNTVA
jgi:hypothetical protein